jgi:hypothetical protein
LKKTIAAGDVRLPQPLFIFILCAALFVIGPPIYAQSVESALERSGYSQPQKHSIIAFFAEAEQSEIPPDLLLPKLEEGISKGIPAPGVLGALMQEADNLLRTRGLLLRSEEGRRLLADPASWARAANLLSVGVAEDEIEQLIALCGARIEGFRPASYLYVAVMEWGLSGDSSLDLIGALLSSSIPPDSYMGVMDLLAIGRRRRIAPEELVQRILQHLGRAKSIKELEKWIY